MRSRAVTVSSPRSSAISPAAMSLSATATLSAGASLTMLARRSIGIPVLEPRHSGLLHHRQRSSAVALADIAGGRPAAARRQPDELHAELIEIPIAARIFTLDAGPQLVERHRLLDHHPGDLGIVAALDLVDQ